MIQMEYQVLIETVEETKQISSGVTKEDIINKITSSMFMYRLNMVHNIVI